MKTKLFFINLLILLSVFSKAQNYVTIPDPVFANYLKTNFAACMNGNQLDTTCPAINAAVNLDLRRNNTIKNIYGIQFFKNLGSLNCDQLDLETLPPLPSTLRSLNCDSNKLVTLPVLPKLLMSLTCSRNRLESLPVLPDGLDMIICYDNKLRELPVLPKSLGHLHCNRNLLKTLPVLPDILQTLNCNDNQLTSLPNLNHVLTTLFCAGNQLTTLPALPPKLKSLACGNNQLTSLPALNGALAYLSCNKNRISCFELFPDLQAIDISDNPFKCLPNYIQVMDTTLLRHPLCKNGDLLNNPNGCPSAILITGTIYTDLNSNCKKDVTDSNTVNVPVKLYDNSNKLINQTFSNLKGRYNFYVSIASTYKVVVDTAGLPIAIPCPYPGNDTVVTVSNAGNTTIDFSVLCRPGFDIGVQSISPAGKVFPGEQHTLTIGAGDITTWNNLHCKLNTGGVVKVIVDGPVTYNGPASGALTPSVSGNTYTYNIVSFATINWNSFRLAFTTKTTATASDSVCVSVNVTPVAGDYNTSNNAMHFCYKVFNSYDPNVKEVYPLANVKEGFSDWFTYTIHFQNTGNAPAKNIVLTDTLDVDLNPETFQVMNYSHANQTSLTGYALNIKFADIQLADSTSDPEGSKGFIQYRIKPKVNLPAGTLLHNRAFIYFDYNPPVITNTTVNQYLKPASVNENEIGTILIYPNPGKGLYFIEFEKQITGENFKIEVYNLLGAVVFSGKATSHRSTFDLSNEPNGVYFIKVTGSGQPINKRLIKQ